MSDDLVKRLRDLGDHASFEPHMYHLAADRIEQLEREAIIDAKLLADTQALLNKAEVVMREAADRIKQLEKANRELALDVFAALGQAHDAYVAQVKAEARVAELEAASQKDGEEILYYRERVAELEAALVTAERQVRNNKTMAAMHTLQDARATLAGKETK